MYNFEVALAHLNQIPTVYTRIAGVDIESTGTHFHHDSEAYQVSFTYNDGESILYTAEVDPMTRKAHWHPADLADMTARLLDDRTLHIFSNAKFDIRGLCRLLKLDSQRLLRRCHDTIFQHHTLNNLDSHALKDAAIKYAKIPDNDETALHKAAKRAREIGRKLGWKIASKESCPQQKRAPSKKKEGWAVMDMWMPRAVAKYNWDKSGAKFRLEQALAGKPAGYAKIFCDSPDMKPIRELDDWKWHPPEVGELVGTSGHKWWSLSGIYCSFDTLRSVVLHQQFISGLSEQGLTRQYMTNRAAIPISYETEEFGITINVATARSLITKFEADRLNANYALNGALGLRSPLNPASTKAVRNILYGYFKLPVGRLTKPKSPTSIPQPACDSDFLAETAREFTPETPEDCKPPLWQKGVESYSDFRRRMGYWHQSLISKEKPSTEQIFAFVTSLMMFKKANTSIKYLEGYLHSCIPLPGHPDFAILHPSLNPIGTKTTRYSSSNPNGQNVSKGGKGKKGLEWLFATNHSLRSVFGPAPGREWWSFDYRQIQLVIFALLCGDEKMVQAVYRGDDFHTFVAREIFGLSPDEDPTDYQRDIAKTVNFAFIFGAQEDKLNRTAGIEGLYKKLSKVFPKAFEFLQATEWEVRDLGYITTPGGNRLYIPEETPYAGVNYKVQGAEGEIVKLAQIGIQHYFDTTLRNRNDMFMTLYIHDDLLFDAKFGLGFQHAGNIMRIMNDAATYYGFGAACAEPKIIRDNWSNGKKLSAA